MHQADLSRREARVLGGILRRQAEEIPDGIRSFGGRGRRVGCRSGNHAGLHDGGFTTERIELLFQSGGFGKQRTVFLHHCGRVLVECFRILQRYDLGSAVRFVAEHVIRG